MRGGGYYGCGDWAVGRLSFGVNTAGSGHSRKYTVTTGIS